MFLLAKKDLIFTFQPIKESHPGANWLLINPAFKPDHGTPTNMLLSLIKDRAETKLSHFQLIDSLMTSSSKDAASEGETWKILKISIKRGEDDDGRLQFPFDMKQLTLTFSPSRRSFIALCPKQSVRGPQSSHLSTLKFVAFPFPVRCLLLCRTMEWSFKTPLQPQEQSEGILSFQKDLFLIYLA